MRCLILYAALLSAVSGYKTPSYGGNLNKYTITTTSTTSTTLQPDLQTLKFETSTEDEVSPSSASSSTASTSAASSESSSSPSSSSTTQTNLIEEVASELPVSVAPVLQEVDLPSLPSRRMVTYDQRQEGQYNIRADLDNFMIVLIPPGPSEGLGLLDLLTRSSLRRTSHTSKGKKKHYSTATSLKPEHLKHLNYLGFKSADQMHVSASRPGEFIEGRTPYHVDISSLNDEEIQPRLNPDRQVDVLPPNYPLAYPHLMKPYHLEAESSLLPPSELGLQHNAETAQSQNTGYYRFARYIRGENFLDSNRVTSSNRLNPQTFRRQQLPVYRSELSMGAAQMYPPLDVPQFSYHVARNFGSKSSPSTDSSSAANEEVDSKQSLDSDISFSEIILPPAHLPLEDDLDLALNDDSLLEGEAKALLSDGIERCAPGKRRDSYGVCREIEGY